MPFSLKGNMPAAILTALFLALVSFTIGDNARSWQHRGVIKAPVNQGYPISLKIPSIGVDAAIEHVGLTQGGALESPKDPAKVGLFGHGPLPGQKGSAIIDGHFGWWDRKPAAFDSLGKVQKGDKIYVEYGEGRSVSFVVRDVRTFGKDEDTSSVFSSSDGKAHLNLITCVGPWNAWDQSYPDRLVVFADMI